jgi:hypothetical protein
MISAKLRDALQAFSLLVMIGGPAVSVIGVVALSVQQRAVPAQAFANVLEFFVLSILAGGLLRLLVSIDARLEAQS